MTEKTEQKQTMTVQRAGLLQGRAYRILNTHMDRALHPFGITIPEWKLLGQLYDNGSMNLAEAAELLGVEAPLVTALVDQLEKKKLVTRKSNKKDRRIKLIALTLKSQKMMPEVEMAIRLVMRPLIEGVKPEEMRIYLHVLATIIKNG
jgi:MarR family transcriptional regulator, transcriptional regulator for hemolysin